MTIAAIRVDADHAIGYGHVTRALSVAAALKDLAHEPVFITRHGSLAAAYIAQKSPDRVLTFSDDASETDTILSAGPGLVLLDVGSTSHGRVEPIKACGCFIVTFDDLGDGRYLADLVVDSNITEETNPKKLQTPTRYLLGPHYAILSPACIAARKKRRKFNGLHRIIVTCGGSDPLAATPRIVQALANFDTEIDVELVLGPGFAHGEALNEALLASHRSFSVTEKPDDLPARLRAADAGIVSGGLTLFEAAYLGLPSLVIGQNQAQLKNAAPFAARNAVVTLGLASNGACDKAPDALAALRDSETRKRMSTTLQKSVDGKGLSRLMAEIKQLLGQ